jgi:hypothetical protein
MDFAMRWPDLPRSDGSVARNPSPPSTSYAEERMAAQSRDGMPSIWPILTSVDLAVASSPPMPAVKSEYMLALVAGALAFAAVIIRSISKLVAAGRFGRSGLRHQRRSALNAPRSRRLPLPAVADTAALARHADVVGKSAAAACRGDVAHRPSKVREETAERPSDPSHDIEETLQRLLDDWQRVAA